MLRNIVESALGHYQPVGNPADADCVIGHSFGTSQGLGSPNYVLAQFIAGCAEGREVFADKNLADVLPPDVWVGDSEKGTISTSFGGGTGTWGSLEHAKDWMTDRGYETALMVAQADHIGRVVMQAQHPKIDIDCIVPPGLPEIWDPESTQWWTRSKRLWVPHEVIGSFALAVGGKLRWRDLL